MDVDFGNLLSMAGNISGTVDGAASVFERVRRLAEDGKLPPESAENILTLSTQLSDAQVKLARLETEIVKLQHAYDALDEIKQRKRNYVLVETAMGERIYRLKEDAGTGELPHEVCPACYEQNKIRILQPRSVFLKCDSCKAKYRANNPQKLQRVART